MLVKKYLRAGSSGTPISRNHSVSIIGKMCDVASNIFKIMSLILSNLKESAVFLAVKQLQSDC
jgi:hypothetical protein